MEIVLDAGAITPQRAHSTDAGLDLFARESKELLPGIVTKFDTGVSVSLPVNTYGDIRDRSSLGAKGIKVMGGIVDNGYRGNLIVCLCNLSRTVVNINAGDKIAQLIVVPILFPKPIVVDTHLEITERGDNGFGSTDATTT